MGLVCYVYFKKTFKAGGYYGVVLLMAPVKMVSRTTTTVQPECVCALLRHIRNAGVSAKFPLVIFLDRAPWRRQRFVKCCCFDGVLLHYTVAPPQPRSQWMVLFIGGEMVYSRINREPREHEVTFRRFRALFLGLSLRWGKRPLGCSLVCEWGEWWFGLFWLGKVDWGDVCICCGVVYKKKWKANNRFDVK